MQLKMNVFDADYHVVTLVLARISRALRTKQENEKKPFHNKRKILD